MQIDESAPVTARREIGVAASREIVWELLTTMDKWADWNPDVKTASQPELEKGGVFRWKAGPASLTSTLAEVDRPTQLSWTGTSMGMHAVHVWHLEANGTGTLARTEESWSGALPKLLPGMMRRSLEKTLDAWLTHLKAEAEARSST